MTSAPPGGEGATHPITLTFSSTFDSMGWDMPDCFPGIRLPRLVAALRETDAPIDEWPAFERDISETFGREVPEMYGAHQRAHEPDGRPHR